MLVVKFFRLVSILHDILVCSQPMSVDNIHLNLKKKVNTKGENIRGCSLLPDGRMVFSCYRKHIVAFLNTEGVELFNIFSPLLHAE
jgi:hypothetical protein